MIFSARLLLITCLLSMPATAAEIVTGNDYAPYSDEKLPEGGFATELVRTVFGTLGEAPRIRFLPWKRGYQMTAAGEVTATFPYVKNPDREAEMLFSDALYFDLSRIFFNKAAPIAYSDMASLKGKTLCNPTGYVVYPEIKAALEAKELRAQEPNDMPTCLKFLDVGRADFIISSIPVMSATASELGLKDKIGVAETPFKENASYLIVGKNTAGGADFLRNFNAGLASFKASPAYAALVKKHGLEGTIR